MTRSIGDMVAASVGVTAEPEITVFPNINSNDKIIVIASDGIWDRFPSEEVASVIGNTYYPKGDAEGAAAYLVNESATRWSTEQGMIDDITIIVAFLNNGEVTDLGQHS
jgi:serine/threonine protein phosphatase PrpC